MADTEVSAIIFYPTVLYVSVIKRSNVFFVSTDDDKSGKSVEQHENRKCCTHRKCFRKNTGKKFAGKRTQGVEHKECSVKAPFHVVRNIGLGCGNADVIGSNTKDSDKETSDSHRIERSVKIECFDDGNNDVNKKSNAEFLFCSS